MSIVGESRRYFASVELHRSKCIERGGNQLEVNQSEYSALFDFILIAV
jgi:hypothetical protein